MFELLFGHPLWAYRNGEFAFASGWPRGWLLAAWLLGAAVIVWGLQRRRSLGALRVIAIGALQVALLSLTLVLLWRPVLNVERVRDRQNQLALAVDASGSMQSSDAGAAPRLTQSLQALHGGALDAMRKVFDVRAFQFATDVQAWPELESPPAADEGADVDGEWRARTGGENQTRIGDALSRILKTAGGAPLAAVVLISDGAENGASLSEERLAELASYGVPIHAVGVGAERIDNDLELVNLRAPMSAAPGATVTAEVTVRAQRLARGAKKTTLRVYDRDALIATREAPLDGRAEINTFHVEFPIGEPGAHDLRFALDALPGEVELINNERRAVLVAPETRRAVLYLEGEPRWEFKFIRRALERERGLRLVSVVRTTPNKFYRQGVNSPNELSAGFPASRAELFAYDAVIIGSLEASTLTPEQHAWLKEFVDRRGGGVLMLAGRFGLGDGGWRTAPLAQTLPTVLPAKGEGGESFVRRPMQALLTEYGMESPMLRLDADPRRNLEAWRSLPALANYQALGKLKPAAIVLLDGKTERERMPLLAWQRYGRGSAYVFGAASTQRWQMSLPLEDQRHETFWRQLAHALADATPARVSVRAERSVYEDERVIRIEAEVRDEQFAIVADAEVQALIAPERGPAYTQTLQASGERDGRFVGAIDAPASGMYRIDVVARRGAGADKKRDPHEYGADSAYVRREDGVIEHFGREQHRSTLQRIAAATGGRYWTLAELPQLAAAIPYSKAGIIERQTLDLWHIPAAFLLLLAFKLSEWALRLKWGRL